MNEEKRKYSRYAVQIPALIKILGPAVPFEAVTVLNISADGIGFSSPVKLPKGTQIKIDMELPGQDKISLKAEIMWADQFPNEGQFKAGVFIHDSHSSNEEKFIKYYCLEMLKNVSSKTPPKNQA